MTISISEIYIDGKFSPKRLNNATFEELFNWIKLILKGDEPFFRVNEIETPHDYLRTIFHKLDPQTRGTIEDIIIQFLKDLVFNNKSEWNSFSAKELLLFLPDVFLTSQRTSEPTQLLLQFISMRKEVIADKEGLLWRVLQTLVRLKFRCNPEFWLNLYSNYGDDIADIVFAGLTLTDLQSAFTWLSNNHSKPKVVHSLILRLPFLVKEFGMDGLQNYLVELMCIVSDDNKKRIYRISSKLGFVLYPPILIKLSEKIDSLANALNYEFPADANTFIEKIMYLDIKINSEFPIEQNKYQKITPDLAIINGISKFIEKSKRDGKAFSFPRDLRIEISNYAENLKAEMAIEDKETLSYDKEVIETTGVDFSSEWSKLRIGILG